MRRYIQLFIGGKTYRFLIDEELEKRLQSSLKNKYQFDTNNNLILDNDDNLVSYQIKQQLLSTILTQIKTFDLTPELQDKINSLEGYINSGKTNIYESDITKLNSILGETSDIYSHVKTNLPKKEAAETKRQEVASNVQELQKVVENSDYEVGGVSSNTSSLDDKLKEFQTILDDISSDETLKEEVPVTEINEAMSRIVICSSMEDFVSKTGSDTSSYNIDNVIKDKKSKIVVPPTLKLEDVVVKVLSTCCENKSTFDKVVTYVERKTTFQTETNKAFDTLRQNLNVKGLTISNVNYFGDQFLNEFISICDKTGISLESMFADYFNGYSANRRYNSPLDRFIRLFIKFNGGDDNTRGMLEALIVKKAISRHLISAKYNNYLQAGYKNIETTGSGYIRFNEENFRNIASSYHTSSEFSSSSSSSISAQTNLNASGSSTLNTSLNARVEEKEQTSLGLGFNDEIVSDVPNFEPTTEKPLGAKLPPNSKGGTKSQPQTTTGGLNSGALSPKGAAKGINKGKQAILNSQKSGIVPKTLNGVRADNPDLTLGFHRNSTFNPVVTGGIIDEEPLDDELDSEETGTDLNLSGDGTSTAKGKGSGTPDGSDNGSENDTPEDDSENLEDNESNPIDDAKNAAAEAIKKKAGEAAKQAIIEFIKKNPYVLAILGGLILFIIVLLIFIAVTIDENNKTQIGYYDQACNFNETNVIVTNCYSNETDKKEYKTINLKDYVLGALYAYTKGEEYNDETLKAAMVTLKTNALSYGNYNSSSKTVEVKSCSINNNFCDINAGCSLVQENYYNNIYTYEPITEDETLEKIEAANSTYISKLETIYESISNYIFVSSSYQSSISTLSSRNALTFNDSTLSEFENLASAGSTFDAILESKYSGVSTSTETPTYRDTIFIGDSRMKGMENTGVINDNNTVYGVGYGYNWLIGIGTYSQDKTNALSGAIEGIKSKMRDNASYNLVFWLGVNDYTYQTANTYFTKYKELATGDFSNHEIYIVAVGPVDDNKAAYVNNEGINNFNSSLEELIANSNISNLHYISLDYNVTSYDSEGLHYGSTDYKNIYNIITSNLDNNISSTKKLYNLNDYCTYYNITKNEAYWWPVGSSSATTGNIYGGTPVSTKITSYFGPRTDPITGQFNKGHGAIDIGVARKTPVIATKDGKVNYTYTMCIEGNYSCGGSYGNHIKIDHGDGIESLYAHLSEVLVSNGSTVTQGQIIGYSGSTGRSTGPHLHFEIRVNGTRVDPLKYVSTDSTRPSSTGVLNVDDSGTTPAENKQIVCKTLLASGYSKNAVIGILINISAEGSFRTNNLENCYEENRCCKVKNSKGVYVDYGFCVHTEIRGYGSDTLYTSGVDSGNYPRDKFVNDHAGYGLIQWTSSGRKAGLYDHAKSQNKSIGALSVQLEYLMEEIKGYPVTYKYITGNYSAYDIANNFCLDFERPNSKYTACPARAKNNLESFTNYVNNNCS